MVYLGLNEECDTTSGSGFVLFSTDANGMELGKRRNSKVSAVLADKLYAL